MFGALCLGAGLVETGIIQWTFDIDAGLHMSLALVFTQISQACAPFISVRFDPDKAPYELSPFCTLAFGQKLKEGRAPANKPVLVKPGSEDELFGEGSMAAYICQSYFQNNKINELWVIAQNDSDQAVAAEFDLTITGSITQSATINLWIKGQKIQITMANKASAAEIASSISAAVNSDPSLPVRATSLLGTTTLTAKNAGETAGEIDIRWLYEEGEKLPTGVHLSLTTRTAGETDPPLDGAVNTMRDQRFDVIINPYLGASQLDALESEIKDRWSAVRALNGYWIGARKGSIARLSNLGKSRKFQYGSIIGSPSLPNSACEIAAAAAGKVAKNAFIQPARPFRTLELTGILPPLRSEEFGKTMRNKLLCNGISTYTVDCTAKVCIETLVTLSTSAFGLAYANYPLIVNALYRSWLSSIYLPYSCHTLLDNETQVLPTQSTVSPEILRLDTIKLARNSWIKKSWIKDITILQETLTVKIDPADPKRINCSFYLKAPNEFSATPR